jgi:alpha,alpha-trehalase
VCGLGNRKNVLFRELVAECGVTVYPSTVGLIQALRAKGFRTAVVSSSENTQPILESVHLSELFDAKVDGVDLVHLGLRGKPAPDAFLEACARLDVRPESAAVVEDAIAGVQAGRSGRFGCVVGVDRVGHAEALRAAGADLVVADLAELAISD